MAKAARESGTDADKLRVRRTLEKVLSEGFFFDTMAAIGGLSELRERAAIPALSAYMNSALDARLARQAEGAVEALRGEGGMPPEVKSLRDELEKLKEESSKLKDQVEKLKAQKKEPAKPASKPARPVKATRKKK
jgi:cell division protein FtsB